MTYLALPWFVLVTTGSAAKMSVVLAVQILPMAILGVPSGTLVQKLGSRTAMLACDFGRAPLIMALPLLHSAGVLSFGLLLAIETSRIYTDIWLNEGLRAVLQAIAEADADWLAVQFETTRRVRIDPGFRRLLEKREQAFAETRSERLARLRPQVRADIPVESVAIFLSFVANGLALRVSLGEPVPDLDAIAQLVEEGVAPR
jgi:hypothetical protein